MRSLSAWVWPFILIMACSAPDESARLRAYLTKNIGLAAGHLPSAVIVITEDGCNACDSKFADLMRLRTGCQRCLFIVRAEGMSIDMNGFLEPTDNLRFDDGSFRRLGILQASGMILMQDGRIDRILALERTDIGSQLALFECILDTID